MKNTVVQWVTVAFFVALLIVGFAIHLDYGNGIDDSMERGSGLIGLRYIDQRLGQPLGIPQGHLPELLEYVEKDHINVMQHFITAIQIIAETSVTGKSWEQVVLGMQHNIGNPLGMSVTHLSCFLMFFAGLFSFYHIVLDRWKSQWMALWGVLLLGLYPRIFADAFYNVKDISLLFLFLVGYRVLMKVIDQPGYKHIGLLVVLSGLAVGCRILGFFLPLVSAIVLFLMILGGYLGTLEKWLPKLLVFGLGTLLAIYLFWPFLWEDPIGHMIYSINRMKDFPWRGQNLYRGEFLPAGKLPWHYLLVWIIITTPPVSLLLIIIGLAITGVMLLRQFFSLRSSGISQVFLKDLSAFCLGILPLAMIVVMRPTLYDGWRHFYFAFPFLLYSGIAVMVLASKQGKLLRNIVQGSVIVQLIATCYFLIAAHPVQNVYFNFMADDPQFRYELDYWGQAHRKGLAYLVKKHPSGKIKLAMDFACINNLGFLSPEDIARIDVVPIAESDYFMTNFRGIPTDPARGGFAFDVSLMREKKFPYNLPEIYTVNSQNLKVLAIYKMR